MHADDIEVVTKIHSQRFPKQHDSPLWIRCNFAAFPRIMFFVARDEQDHVIGYIQWIQKSGFLKQAVFELEQIAVISNHQSKGVGIKLIQESLSLIKNYLEDTDSKLKAILIFIRTDNKAKTLCEKVLRAKEIAVIKDVFSYEEVLMLSLQM
jgi:ribosomal protein S18 acetylase RimI-like enzyme